MEKEEEVSVLSYNEVLEKLQGQENHLLLGNGFNRGLGVNTGYGAIFNKMMEENHGIYKDALPMVKEYGFDLEKFIGRLEDDIASNNLFLKKYVRNKVKLDFMKATHEIVKSEIKNIYAEKNEGVYILLNHFSNYFTLNYDSFLYLLLLNFKANDNIENNAIAIQPTLNFVEEDLNIQHNDIYSEIKKIRNGSLTIVPYHEDNLTNASIDRVTKGTFVAIINQYSKSNNKNWKTKEIEQVVNYILEEEKKNQVLDKVDDGTQFSLFRGQEEFIFNISSETQNLFFLHGAFHIYKDGESYKKITQQSDKALYDRLESILNNEEQDIVCVFQSENKLEAINENKYLRNCLNKLDKLIGNMVIIGSSLADNDNHIFERINASGIDTLYISTLLKYKKTTLQLAKNKFPSKEIYLFDAETISYELPNEGK